MARGYRKPVVSSLRSSTTGYQLMPLPGRRKACFESLQTLLYG